MKLDSDFGPLYALEVALKTKMDWQKLVGLWCKETFASLDINSYVFSKMFGPEMYFL